MKQVTWIVLGYLGLLAFPAHANDNITVQLGNVYEKYHTVKTTFPDERLELLIELDKKLRTLIDKPWTQHRKTIDGYKYWKKEYQDIGVKIGHYSDSPEYTGKFLIEAKALDVGSKHGEYTNYADICNGAGSFGGCYMPNIEAALVYEEKYPNGPFIADVLIIIGNFYDDLYKAIKDKDSADYKNDCFSKYVTEKPIPDQMEHARKSAIEYYTKFLALHSDNNASNKTIREWVLELKAHNSSGWHFCSD